MVLQRQMKPLCELLIRRVALRDIQDIEAGVGRRQRSFLLGGALDRQPNVYRTQYQANY